MRLSLKRDRVLLGSLLALLFIALACVIAPGDPQSIDPDRLYHPPQWSRLLGSDELGRDFLARLLHGGRVSLLVAIFATLLSVGAGGILGMVAGYLGGWVDRAFMAVVQLMMVIPKLPLMLLIAAVDLDVQPTSAGLPAVKLVLVFGLFGWVFPARLGRAAAQSLRSAPYVEAARALGATRAQVIRRHVLPGVGAPLLVAASEAFGETIVYESVLSFLGMGVQAPASSWGLMLAGGLTHFQAAPRMVIAPGLLTAVIVGLAFLVGDRLQLAWDPRLRSRWRSQEP